jgi:hypothetical protein
LKFGHDLNSNFRVPYFRSRLLFSNQCTSVGIEATASAIGNPQ